jgi:predicted enzyme related to lactoylglutathione lyase
MEDETAGADGPIGLPVVIVDIGIDVNNLEVMTKFWESLVGFETVRSAHNYSYMVNPSNVGPHLFLQLVPEVRTEKNRLHLDIVVPSLPEAVRRAEALGAIRVAEYRTHITWFVVLEDPEGNQFCLVDAPYWNETKPPYWESRDRATSAL